MERRSLESGDQTRGMVVQNLLISGTRLSAGPALDYIEQLQHLSTSASGRGVPAIADQIGTTLDSVTDFWRPVWTTRGETR